MSLFFGYKVLQIQRRLAQNCEAALKAGCRKRPMFSS
ncbi:hypothetical protein Patl1_27399 [Pistacia atlantica]|uniref:Uncharacterized protein n=1 Tax=Pistacia atlantica TaxID=434234 RepID=A0ACC1BEG5_9ROSI|nr:hypothetical protein Patl1_27399 [Pistacia atlantica]